MTKQEIGKLAIELLQAEMYGRQIQFKDKGESKWEDVCKIKEEKGCTSAFNFNLFDYRIKPEKKLVPFTWEDRDNLIGKTVLGKGKSVYCTISRVSKENVSIYLTAISYTDLLQYWTFADDSPCGKEVEE